MHISVDIMPRKDLMVLKILLENGAHPDKRDRYGKTLLYKVCMLEFKLMVHLLLLFNADLEISCQVGTHISESSKSTPFTYLHEYCSLWVDSGRPVDIRTCHTHVLESIEIAHSLAKAGTAVYKDNITGKSVNTLCDWTHIENTLLHLSLGLTEEEIQKLSDGVNFIKLRLTHPTMLKYLCGYSIRRILRPPDFHRKLTRLSQESHLPQKLIDDYIAMKDMFPWEGQKFVG